jgi:hypothetical protein
LLLRFEFLNLVLQAGDPFVSLVQELFIEQELGSELVLSRELLLQLGDLCIVLPEGLGIFRFPLCQCCLSLLKPLGERFQLTDSSLPVGQLAVELVQCGSLLGVSIAELHFQPMDPSLGRFEFFHARA